MRVTILLLLAAACDSTSFQQPPAPPPTPAGLIAQGAKGQVSLSWSASATADSYALTRSAQSGGPYLPLASPSTTSFVDTGVQDGTAYYYEVAARRGSLQSGFSGEVRAITIPPAPSGLTATADTSIALAWSAAAGADTYKVERGTASGGPYTQIASPSETLTDDSAVQAGVRYYYVVVAVNESGESAPSAEASALIPLPGQPQGVVATPLDSSVSLSWNAVDGATRYSVKRSLTTGGPYSIIATPVALSYVDTGLDDGTTYYYVIAASNASGSGPDSAEVSATPESSPQPPTLTATAQNSAVLLTWTAVDTATSYLLFRTTTSGAGYQQIFQGAALEETDSAVVNGTTYYYVVQAVNAVGTSGNSAEASATPQGPPAAPTGLAGAAGDTRTHLTWTAVDGAASYQVLRDGASVGTPGAPPFDDSGLTDGVTYSYTVKAVNGFGAGPASDPLPLTPQARGNMLVADDRTSVVALFPVTQSADAAPLSQFGNLTGLLSPQMVAIDAANAEIFVADGDSILVFDESKGGNAPPKRRIAGPATGISGAWGVAIDSVNDQLWVSSSGNDSILAFARGASGNVSPTGIIAGANTTLSAPLGIAVEPASGEVSVDSGSTTLTFNLTDSGNVAPRRTITIVDNFTGGDLHYDATPDLLFVNWGPALLGYPRTLNGNDSNYSPAPQLLTDNQGGYGAFAIDTTNDAFLVTVQAEGTVASYPRSSLSSGPPGSYRPAREWTLTASAANGVAVDSSSSDVTITTNSGDPASTSIETWSRAAITAAVPDAPTCSNAASGRSSPCVAIAPERTISPAPGGVLAPQGIAVDLANGEVYVASSGQVSVFPLAGAAVPVRSFAAQGVQALAYDAARGRIIVAAAGASPSLVIYARDADGSPSPVATLAGVVGPRGLALDALHDELFVSDWNNSVSRILVFDAGSGALLRTFANQGQPLGLAIDAIDGELFVGDSGAINALDRVSGKRKRFLLPTPERVAQLAVDIGNDELIATFSCPAPYECSPLVAAFRRDGDANAGTDAPLRQFAGPLSGVTFPTGVALAY